jgi:SAM-dependent methyltransferase
MTIDKPAKRTDRWETCVALGTDWEWRDGRLWHRNSTPPLDKMSRSWLRRAFVNLVYADQNRSRAVRKVLAQLLSASASGLVLNVGAGSTRFPRVVNIDLHDGPTVDVIAADECLPFQSGCVDLVILQEVLEHVPYPDRVLCEIARVLRPGGHCYCQVPFQIGFHPGPSDFWRFSRQGLEQLFAGPEWQVERLEIALGHGSGFFRIAVEFVAVTASCLWQRLYLPAKCAAAICLYPLKLFDFLTSLSREADRIPGGYLCVARRV